MQYNLLTLLVVSIVIALSSCGQTTAQPQVYLPALGMRFTPPPGFVLRELTRPGAFSPLVLLNRGSAEFKLFRVPLSRDRTVQLSEQAKEIANAMAREYQRSHRGAMQEAAVVGRLEALDGLVLDMESLGSDGAVVDRARLAVWCDDQRYWEYHLLYVDPVDSFTVNAKYFNLFVDSIRLVDPGAGPWYRWGAAVALAVALAVVTAVLLRRRARRMPAVTTPPVESGNP